MRSNPKLVLIAGAIAALASVRCARHTDPPETTPQPDEVSVGYGTQAKGDVTGAVTSVPAAELGGGQPLRIEELLRGRVAGLEIVYLPGGNVAFKIRGNTALRRDQEQHALVVVDGVMIPASGMASAIAGLIPEDIKRVDVLKDVASTSIYGMRGAGGVIVITTTRR